MFGSAAVLRKYLVLCLIPFLFFLFFFFFQAEDGIRDWSVTGVQTCALPIYRLHGLDDFLGVWMPLELAAPILLSGAKPPALGHKVI